MIVNFSLSQNTITGLKVVMATGLLAVLYYGDVIDLVTLGQLITHPQVVMHVVVIVLVSMILSGLRWNLLLSCQGIHVSGIKSVQIVFITVFLSSFLPGGFLTSDALRTAYVIREAPGQRTAAAWSIFFDRVVGLYSLFLLCFIFSWSYRDAISQHVSLQLLGSIATGVSIGLPLAIFVFLRWSHTPWGGWLFSRVRSTQLRWILDRLVHAFDLYKETPKRMALVLFLGVFNHALTIACILVIVVAIGFGTLNGSDYVLVTLWSTAANALPITPGGVGVGEGSFDQIAHMLEVVPSTAGYGTIFLVFRIVSSMALLPGLVFYLIYRTDLTNILRDSTP
ncbi:MAG TPA: hypothetical protein DCS88_02730 [Alphaproteobacteria bacterium]|nr:hypothetical protein [Alphaproteobacteria bacterium]